MGENFLKFDRKIKSSINNCFSTVQLRVVFFTRQILMQYLRPFFPLFNKVMLYIISMELLSQKILSKTKIQGIFHSKSNLKVSHYADDLTFLITSPHSFLPLCEILDDFSNFSGLKINHSKTTIISNSPSLLSSFYSIYPQGKTLTSAKIFGISFPF